MPIHHQASRPSDLDSTLALSGDGQHVLVNYLGSCFNKGSRWPSPARAGAKLVKFAGLAGWLENWHYWLAISGYESFIIYKVSTTSAQCSDVENIIYRSPSNNFKY